ncbi:methylated-DNA--[protein]-cysteine S-methyltransferase [Spirabiliibacterium falconis]|uniref:methylated-DNA--[protein]-cysteine S-methyltransferase n=1 Tax=Spirabiliibacterium falconis TaxID=572023 RepID=UPI001AAD8933|nr:methylated-DNA--[protein]-cysteine S-methyltransferase [Spirabiliibacterium falconis]MBE2893783.1 methylated-DNA--[protein]-cysteine S-methyltransferase [Spirabiliibacterium falconis]
MPQARYVYQLNTPIGIMTLLADDNALRGAFFAREMPHMQPHWITMPNHPILAQASTALLRYFNGEHTTFHHLPIAPIGSAFQCKVWQALQNIEYGESLSYGQLAEHIGRKSAVRAVANAVGKNPLGIIIPCHRVLGKQRQLTGFGGGLPAKRYLLNLEGIAFTDRGKEFVNPKHHRGL